MNPRWLIESDREAQSLLLSAHPFIGCVFTAAPAVVALIASFSALVFLFVPAYLVGLARISTSTGNVGFVSLPNWNWSLVYPVFLPAILVFGNYTVGAMRTAVYRLIKPGMAVIYDEQGQIAVDYPDSLKTYMSAYARYVVIASAVLAAVIVVLDTKDLWPGFVTWHYPSSRAPEWDTAFAQLKNVPGYVPPARWKNLLFDLIAYAFETSYAFLGVFYVLTSLTFLLGIARVLDARHPPYHFEPIACDYRRRLGLSPLAWVFNWFLVVVLGFEAFAVAHRVQQIDRLRRCPRTTYLQSLIKDSNASDKGQEKGFHVSSLLNLRSKDYAMAELRNPSSWVPLVVVFLPAAVVCFLPLGIIRQIIRTKVENLIDQNTLALSHEEEQGNADKATGIRKTIGCLKESSIWPNGNAAGWTFLILMGGLLVVAVAPPVVPYAISSGAVPGLLKLGKKLVAPQAGGRTER